MDRIGAQFQKARDENRACFIAYVAAGDPDLDGSFEVCRTLVEGGVDLIELGVPFSDPLADGLTNQLAAQRALNSGMTREKVLQLVQRLRELTEIPIIFYTYYNLVFSPGIENYVRRAKEAGVDGLLTLDLPPEEAKPLSDCCREHGLKTVFIVAPTTPPERMDIIARETTGFIYYVPLLGVTGERMELADNIGPSVAEIKKHTNLPVVVGFGISRPDQVREVASVSDGVVVGSALVNCIAADPTDISAIKQRLGAKLADLLTGLK